MTALSLLGLAALAVAALCVLLPALCAAWDRGSRHARAAFLAACAGATLFAGAKHVVGTIRYPRTDPETWYLADSGSYVTNDSVHVSFTRNLVVPPTATFYLDALALQYTNQSDWAEHAFTAYSSAFANMTLPFDLPYAAATNYNWIAYTDWVPPPTTHTNGIAYVSWQVGVGKATNDLAMTRTGVYRNALRLAPNPAITNAPPGVQLTTVTQPETTDNEP